MVWRPWTAHDYLDPGQMARGHLITVLVFLNFFVINEVGNVDEHSAGVNLAAANVLVKWSKNLVDLNGKSAGLGLAFTLADGLFTQFAQVFATYGIWQLNFFQRFTQ